MFTTTNVFYAVRIDFGDTVKTMQYDNLRTAELVLAQSRAQFGYDNACLVEVHHGAVSCVDY